MSKNNPWSRWKVRVQVHLYEQYALPAIGTSLYIWLEDVMVLARSKGEAETKAVKKVKGHKHKVIKAIKSK